MTARKGLAIFISKKLTIPTEMAAQSPTQKDLAPSFFNFLISVPSPTPAIATARKYPAYCLTIETRLFQASAFHNKFLLRTK